MRGCVKPKLYSTFVPQFVQKALGMYVIYHKKDQHFPMHELQLKLGNFVLALVYCPCSWFCL